MKSNYYIALLFKKNNDLHLTVNYFTMISPGELCVLIAKVDKAVKEESKGSFDIVLDEPGHFGANGHINVLKAPHHYRWPQWVRNFVESNWSPHVTTQKSHLSLKIDRVAVMQRQDIVCCWDLGDPEPEQGTLF